MQHEVFELWKFYLNCLVFFKLDFWCFLVIKFNFQEFDVAIYIDCQVLNWSI